MRTRRELLAAGGALAVGALAGCSGALGNGSASGSTSSASQTSIEKVQSLPTPVRGDPKASVTVMVFEDYACPHCAHYATEIEPDIVKNYTKPGKIRYEHHDFPIPVSKRWSWAGGNAARAVQDGQGDSAFFSYTHTLFANQSKYVNAGSSGYDYLGSAASGVGADASTVIAAAKNGTYDPVLKTDRKKGLKMGLRGTPTVYVNGKATNGYGYDTVSAAIDKALSGQ